MKRQLTFYTPKNLDMKRLYIVTDPSKKSNLSLEDFNDLDIADVAWQEKAKRLQARRWRKIKHQMVQLEHV